MEDEEEKKMKLLFLVPFVLSNAMVIMLCIKVYECMDGRARSNSKQNTCYTIHTQQQHIKNTQRAIFSKKHEDEDEEEKKLLFSTRYTIKGIHDDVL